MNELLARILPHGTVAVVGLAKNTGKTVTVNYLVAHANFEGMRLGLTSTGRDGETVDVLTALAKPKIFLPRKAVLATARASLKRGSASLEILETTGISNPLGEIVLARVQEAGTVEISGPERTEDLMTIVQSLKALSDLVIIDGALDRISASAPAVTGAAILATGAAVASDLQGVVHTTVHAARVLLTSEASQLSEEGRRLLAQGRSGIQGPGGKISLLPWETIIDAPLELMDYLTEADTLLLGGALTNELAALLTTAALGKALTIILWDGTRVFVEAKQWQRLLRSGAKVEVVESINLEAVTVNPVDPRGRRFSSEQLVGDIQKLLPGQLVLDPLAEGGGGNELHR